ncbi:flavin containing amine oxidoreductase family protein [Mycobacterium xenopi 3993]|nr:flavin containing amine oxidoreductase family protein [Mycobacterium xenopi 3993]
MHCRGGISGLTAAYRLRALVGDDVTITVFDPADRLGGVLRTERVGGQPVDVGAEAFVVRRPEVPALLAELGLSDRHLGTTGARPLIYSQGRLHPLPSGTIAGIPSSAAAMAGLVDEATVARIAAEPGRPLDWRAGDDPVTAALVADRFGPQVVARSVDPLLGGVYAGSAATIGVRSAAPGLAMALDGGAASLTDAVRAALPAVTDGPVFGAVDGGYAVLVDELIRRSGLSWERVGSSGSSRRPGWTLCDGAGGQWRADGVILAVPARGWPASSPRLPAQRGGRQANRLCIVGGGGAGGAARYRVSRAVRRAGGQRGSVARQGDYVVVAQVGRRSGLELVRLSFGRFDDDVGCRATDDELLAWAVGDLATVFGVTVEPVDVRVRRWVDAMPQYGPGHADIVAEIRAGLPPALAVAGNYLDGIGVPACIAAARRAVSELLGAGVAR